MLTRRGFTTLELVVVLTLVGVLSAVVFFTYGHVTDQAQSAGVTADVQTAARGVSMTSTMSGARVLDRDLIVTVLDETFPHGGGSFATRLGSADQAPGGAGDFSVGFVHGSTVSDVPSPTALLASADSRGRVYVVRVSTAGVGVVRVFAAGTSPQDVGGALPVPPDGTVGGPVVVAGQLVAGDGADWEYFGDAVAVDGQTAVVGVPWQGDTAGAVYVFTHTGEVWVEQTKLVASDGSVGDYFGWSVDVSGDWIAVGAVGDPDEGYFTNAVYMFQRQSDGSWVEQNVLVPADWQQRDYFGFSVAVDGTTVVVGSEADDDHGSSSGSAYVFTYNGSAWSQQAKLTASDAAPHAYFGYSVTLDGGTVVVGAIGARNGGVGEYAGAAYVFTNNGSTWSQQAKLVAATGAAQDTFGGRVGIDGDTVVVGSSGHAGTGAAYVFVRDGVGVWHEQAQLVGDDSADGDGFGYAVTVSGDLVVVGSATDGTYVGQGSVYVFERAGEVWGQREKVTSPAPAEYGDFGASVAVDGSTVFVGAPWEPAGGVERGAVYVLTVP